ncbi:MAG: Serine acetyltransferase, partial [Actinomycetia bacterium]|nr:Serine acetyltransferase [Actinomycetes bacterium]
MANSSSRATVRTAAEIRSAQPKFVAAVLGDAKVTAAYRSERFEFRGRTDAAIQALRLAWRSDAFLAQVCYRAQARLSSLGVPIVPRIAHRLAMLTAQLCIGESGLVHPGVYFAHGQVVI